ncbi:MAG: sarcosine oxidase subunit gamma [Betaproteobacteria bacterium]|nr:sarcosine oxidase subunit gamma [Betaproteobacteria bacterium]
MVDTLIREPACLEACCTGQFGASTPHAGITFAARTRLRLINMRGNPAQTQFLDSARTALGCALPLTANTSCAAADAEVFWLGPDEWLIAGSQNASISETLPIGSASLTDVSHGRAAWRIAGPRVYDLLAKGCSLDLHSSAFSPGGCAQTSIAHVGVLLYLRGDGSFDLYCARSYAQHLWHWLTEAAAEYGYEVTASID